MSHLEECLALRADADLFRSVTAETDLDPVVVVKFQNGSPGHQSRPTPANLASRMKTRTPTIMSRLSI
jgi:hypothetical protein